MKIEVTRERELDVLATALRLSRAETLNAIISHVYNDILGTDEFKETPNAATRTR